MAKKDFKLGINNNINQGRGISNLINPAPAQLEKESLKVNIQEETEYVRQTFIIKNDHLEKLKDLTHLRKKENYNITQKDVLENILSEYFNNLGDIEPRPESIKTHENIRKLSIKNGKR